ncbi:hypothetical protein DXG01_012483 [Tephrocybe rancida]|nr:hypothetical protein DXG01_012483 [Tephrocybe rancida]
MTLQPEILWAQRSSATDDGKNIVFLTVNLPAIDQTTLVWNLTSSSVSFQAKTDDGNTYAFELDFFDNVNPERSSTTLATRGLNIIIHKKEKKAEYWPRLVKDNVEVPFLRTDSSKWVNKNEQDAALINVDHLGKVSTDFFLPVLARFDLVAQAARLGSVRPAEFILLEFADRQ